MDITSFEVNRTNRGIMVDLNLRRIGTFLDPIQAMIFADELDAEVAAIQAGENAIRFPWNGELHTITVEGAQEFSRLIRTNLE